MFDRNFIITMTAGFVEARLTYKHLPNKRVIIVCCILLLHTYETGLTTNHL